MHDTPTFPQSLSATDLAVLRVLVDNAGRVVGRATMMRLADLDHLGPRRVDASIVAIRRALGSGSITTVRRRGWMLVEASVSGARDLLS